MRTPEEDLIFVEEQKELEAAAAKKGPKGGKGKKWNNLRRREIVCPHKRYYKFKLHRIFRSVFRSQTTLLQASLRFRYRHEACLNFPRRPWRLRAGWARFQGANTLPSGWLACSVTSWWAPFLASPSESLLPPFKPSSRLHLVLCYGGLFRQLPTFCVYLLQFSCWHIFAAVFSFHFSVCSHWQACPCKLVACDRWCFWAVSFTLPLQFLKAK